MVDWIVPVVFSFVVSDAVDGILWLVDCVIPMIVVCFVAPIVGWALGVVVDWVVRVAVDSVIPLVVRWVIPEFVDCKATIVVDNTSLGLI